MDTHIPKTLSPRDLSPEALREHAEHVAEALKLNEGQTRVLASEIRNALTSASFTAQMMSEGDTPDEEEVSDLKASIGRVLALMNALDRAVR